MIEDLSELRSFSHGFFQDILTLMVVLGQDTITKADAESYLKEKLKELDPPPLIKRASMENASPERKARFIKDMDKRGWELKKPCGGCKKEQERENRQS